MSATYSGRRLVARDIGGAIRATAAALITIPTPPAFVTAGAFAVAAWVRCADLGTLQSVLTNATTTGAPQFRITTTGALEVLPRTAGTSLVSSPCIVRGQWHRVLATCDGNVTTIYCDGQPVATVAGAISGISFAQPAGALTATSNIGNTVAGLTMWARGLTMAEVRRDYYEGGGPAPVARYRFAEGVGTTAVDDFGGASASLSAFAYTDDAPVQPARDAQDWASILQAGASYLTLPSSGSDNLGLALAGRGGLQVSAWVKLTAAQSSIDVLRVNTTGAVGVRLQLDAGTNLIATARAGVDGGVATRATNVTVPLALGRWVHYSLGVDFASGAAGRIYLYRNGRLVQSVAADFSGQTAVAWNVLGGGTQAWLGAGTTGANPMPGWLGAVRIDPLLTPAQVLKLVNTGTSGAGTPLCEWRHTAGVGTTSANTGSTTGLAATLTGAAAWSLDAPW